MNANKEVLHHYTSINTLELILKYKKIRFMPLTGLDDVEEGIIQDKQDFTKYCYVSSWTNDEKESIPMWKMYADTVEGVRITLPKMPFKRYMIDLVGKLNSMNVGLQMYANTVFSIDDSILPINDIFNDKYSMVTNHADKCLVKVAYTDDEARINPKVLTMNNRGQHVMKWDIGMCKNTHWEFQQEWRYILRFMPFGFEFMTRDIFDNDSRGLVKILKEAPDLPFKHKDLDIDEDIFKQIVITLAPMSTDKEINRVRELVNQYNTNAPIKDSILKGRMR